MRLSGAPRWRGGHHPMGDAKSGPVRLWFNPQLRVEFHGATVTSDAGLLLPRELDERLGLSTLIERHLADPRTGRNSQFPLPDLFRRSIYSRLAGYEDTNDAERLAEDPTFRMLASRERRDTSVALTSTLHWFETDVLAEEGKYQGLTRLNTDLVQHPAARSPSQRVVLDIDNSESRVHGAQEQSAYNGTLCRAAITRSSSSTPWATVSRRSFARGTSTVRTGGARFCCPSLIDTTGGGRRSSSARMRRLRFRPSTRRWNAGGCGMRSACRPTMSSSGASRICSPDPGAGPATFHSFATGASTTRRLPGIVRAEWLPRSSITSANCSLG